MAGVAPAAPRGKSAAGPSDQEAAAAHLAGAGGPGSLKAGAADMDTLMNLPPVPGGKDPFGSAPSSYLGRLYITLVKGLNARAGVAPFLDPKKLAETASDWQTLTQMRPGAAPQQGAQPGAAPGAGGPPAGGPGPSSAAPPPGANAGAMAAQ